MEHAKTAETWLQTLATEREPSLREAAQAAAADTTLMQHILDGITAKNEILRYNCFRILLQIADEQPQVLYPQWDTFVPLLGSDNSYHRNIAVNILARLTAADTPGRFEELFDRYFDLLDDESMITARYVARNAGIIARHKPHLRPRVLARLLAIDHTHHDPSRRDLIKDDIIQSVGEFFDALEDKATVLAFVQAQLDCSSPKTRKSAKAFLKMHG